MILVITSLYFISLLYDARMWRTCLTTWRRNQTEGNGRKKVRCSLWSTLGSTTIRQALWMMNSWLEHWPSNLKRRFRWEILCPLRLRSRCAGSHWPIPSFGQSLSRVRVVLHHGHSVSRSVLAESQDFYRRSGPFTLVADWYLWVRQKASQRCFLIGCRLPIELPIV